jgi:MFS family permease
MIRRVGHVRVFAALGSLISAVLILYPAIPEWQAWIVLRVVIGFSFAGVYITAESWLNNAATNETRGQALSAYMIVQMIGIVAAQAILNVAPPEGFLLFVIPSVLVSLAFTPILLTATMTPSFDRTRPLSFGALWRLSPLGCVGMFLTGGIYSAMFAMAAVWGTLAGLTVAEISIFVGAMYLGGLVFQYPIGWISDRMDRRRLILLLSAVGAGAMLLPGFLGLPFVAYVAVSVLLGGIVNPLYSLLIAHTNDFLRQEDMAGASAGLLFINGTGAIAGPVVVGTMMERIGPAGFYLFIAALLGLLALYALWRTTRRAAPAPADTATFQPVAPGASALAVEAAVERRDDQAA